MVFIRLTSTISPSSSPPPPQCRSHTHQQPLLTLPLPDEPFSEMRGISPPPQKIHVVPTDIQDANHKNIPIETFYTFLFLLVMAQFWANRFQRFAVGSTWQRGRTTRPHKSWGRGEPTPASSALQRRASETMKLRYGLLANHGVIVLKLDPMAIMPYLISEGLLSLDEKQVIQSKVTDSEKTDGILTLIHRKAIADESVYERFLNILGDEILSGGQHLQKVVSKVYEDSSDPVVLEMHQPKPGGLAPKQKAALISQEESIVSSLTVDDVLADLVSLGVLSLDENEVFLTTCTRILLQGYLVHNNKLLIVQDERSQDRDSYYTRLVEACC